MTSPKPVSLFKVVSLFKSLVNDDSVKQLEEFSAKNDKYMKALKALPNKKNNADGFKKANDKLKDKFSNEYATHLKLKKGNLRLSGDAIADVKSVTEFVINNLLTFAKNNTDMTVDKKCYRVVSDSFNNEKFKNEPVYTLIKDLPSVKSLLMSNEPVALNPDANFKPIVNSIFKNHISDNQKQLQCTEDLKKFISNVVYDLVKFMSTNVLILKNLDPKCRTISSKHFNVMLELINVNQDNKVNVKNQ